MRSALLVLGLTLAGCTHAASSGGGDGAGTQAAPPVAVEASRTKGIPIATLVTHDAKVTIFGGAGRNVAADDLRVVVRKTDGTLVADGISVEELKDRDPALHALVTNATASRGGYVDATLYRLHAD